MASGFLFAQSSDNIDAASLGMENSAQQYLKEISVDKFEVEGFWRSEMSVDQGITLSRLREGSPEGKAPLADEQDISTSDIYILGTKVDFYHRGPATFKILAEHPLQVEGITKTISVWAAGRNFNHELYVIIQDYSGRQYSLKMGLLNFQGWQQLSIAVPTQGDDKSLGGIKQQDYHYTSNMGIKIIGFEIRCDPLETYGTYYLYLDDLRVVTDLFLENNRDSDDVADDW
ncbi:MAG: flagellar filament outer layer protein FlaA [Treponema sp.]|nr:flagellar filament outer layer protein FlaA [Treponema sp.]